jgi:hypothetical protein
MRPRVIQILEDLSQTVQENPTLKKIIDEDPRAEHNPLLRNHLHDPLFLVGFDFLKLNLKTGAMLEEKNYDLTKIRRRLEEHLRKYATEEDIMKLALYYGVPIK